MFTQEKDKGDAHSFRGRSEGGLAFQFHQQPSGIVSLCPLAFADQQMFFWGGQFAWVANIFTLFCYSHIQAIW